MQKEEQQLEKRLSELSNLAYSRDIVTYSDFLNLNELNIYIRCQRTDFTQSLSLLADMAWQSVRWRHFSLMLFLCVEKCHGAARRNGVTIHLIF